MPLFVVVAIVWIAVPPTTVTASTKASSMPAGAQTTLYGSYGESMAREHDNRWLPTGEKEAMSSMLQRYGLRYDAAEGERRSYRSDSSSLGGHGQGGLGAVLNGLTNLSGLGHISNGYASVAPTHTEALAAASSKQEIPIYEEQHEDAAVAALAATASDYGDTEAGRSGQHSAIYNFPAAGAEHAAGYLPAFSGAEQAAWTPSSAPQYQQTQEAGGSHYAYDKMSVGNFLNSGYEAFQQHHAEEQQHQQQQQHQQHQQQQQLLEHASYFTPHENENGPSAGSDSAGSGPSDYEQQSEGDEHGSNFLAESSAHEDSHGQSHHHHHVDIINYVPVKHVKTQHVPVEKPVKIPISHAVIIPIKKPVPIHIPITKQVQVAVEKELKVPVERLVPVPVEKHIPVPVEKRVPYTVIKYLPIKVPKPFPVKVPVFKTVLHKVKSWW
ncbi:uncharacterized protein LOC111600068 [Drosophila hydei]|uniref:Uncharacterized protein LOC111600068 n=1 Tax=Drosophila hydei TaxID=7224 RepID=A0A6J1LWV7_DROHY|nr:uncharacterized protein LOC111600068 [Drosophila hydei]